LIIIENNQLLAYNIALLTKYFGQMNPNQSREVLLALRRIIHAVDLHSAALMQTVGLSAPQIFALQTLAHAGQAMAAGELAMRMDLTQGTLSTILDRLERKQLVRRNRGQDDRRKVLISLTPAGSQVLADSPPLLQQNFIRAFAGLRDWEQNLLLSSLQRVAELMHAPPPPEAAALLDAPLGSTTSGAPYPVEAL
jgi:DNA-binding MarR family transcriptional regulator